MSVADSEPSDSDESDVSIDSDDQDPADSNYMPSAEWISSFVDHWAASYLLRSRAPLLPFALETLSPVPRILTAGHMAALNFQTIRWDEPRPFTDVADRIGAFFLGPPAQRTNWERTIIRATDEMHAARMFMPRAGGHSVRSGISYNAGLGQPYDLINNEDEMHVLAHLRLSPSILEIVSYQNAMLQSIALRLWNHGRNTVDAVIANDLRLHLPFRYGFHPTPVIICKSSVEKVFEMKSRPWITLQTGTKIESHAYYPPTLPARLTSSMRKVGAFFSKHRD
ncbi:hypothetical protein C8R46DRAFT_1220408 [Mycena filopes]|nr:hypothetical protein C8R46DRAFT_1220408 [Mycena filopes]